MIFCHYPAVFLVGVSGVMFANLVFDGIGYHWLMMLFEPGFLMRFHAVFGLGGWAGIDIDFIATESELDKVGELAKGVGEEKPKVYIGGLLAKEFKSLLEGLAAPEDSWISVERSLPDFGVPVLISSPNLPHAAIAVYEGREIWQLRLCNRRAYGITHWQPLPEKKIPLSYVSPRVGE